MMFRKKIKCAKKVREAKLYATALGIYELAVDGKKVGDRYFAPALLHINMRCSIRSMMSLICSQEITH